MKEFLANSLTGPQLVFPVYRSCLTALAGESGVSIVFEAVLVW
jgi:hypothetical protein